MTIERLFCMKLKVPAMTEVVPETMFAAAVAFGGKRGEQEKDDGGGRVGEKRSAWSGEKTRSAR